MSRLRRHEIHIKIEKSTRKCKILEEKIDILVFKDFGKSSHILIIFEDVT